MESSCSQSVATKSYRIRLRTLDGRSVIMGGFFPADSTMQLLADEIANLGHSDAGTFSIAFPQLANRPPAIYHPAAFNTTLESCGLFSGNLTLTLARPPAAPNWSPPPPLVRGVCPRGRIDAHKEHLEILHQQFPWIPGQDSIRPNPDQLRAKHESQREIDTLYDSYLAFVLIEVFGFPIVAEGHKRKADCSNDAAFPLTVFKPNKFPYAVPAGTNHFIWWTREPTFQTPDRVTRCIEAALQQLEPSAVHNFVWYENPKMTIPEVYHVQVFWSTERL